MREPGSLPASAPIQIDAGIAVRVLLRCPLRLSFRRSDPRNSGGNIRPFHSGLPSLTVCFGNHAIKIAHGGRLGDLEVGDVVFAHDVLLLL